MLPPHEYEKARRNARFHLQVVIEEVPSHVKTPCEQLLITGKVVRIFRGRHNLRQGDFVKFNIAVQGEPYVAMCSGIFWLNYSNLLQAKYMEVYLNGNPPNCSVALWQYALLDISTDQPTMSSESRSWWKFW
jgi:hypothetical protein